MLDNIDKGGIVLLKSMTGFGRGTYSDTEHSFTVELKAVNHRYNDVVVRMPRILNVLEDKIRRTISNKLSRGRVDVFISMEDYTADKSNVQVDKQLALAYQKAFQEVAYLLKFQPTDQHEFSYVIKAPEVVNQKDLRTDAEQLLDKVLLALNEGIDNILAMRELEGKNIYKDLVMRINLLREMLDKIETRAPEVPIEAQRRITERLNELLKDNNIVDQDRLAQEIAILADKTNITEEIVRLKSHFEQFIKTIQSKQAVGRKLDFLVQELNREVNTIASKANDFSITTIAVDMKSEIEKIREQIQNVE